MPKVRKVFLPKWVAWFLAAIILPLWGWIGYQANYDPKGKEELGPVGWLVLSLLLLGVIVMVFLMGYRKLPAYMIEEKEQDNHQD